MPNKIILDVTCGSRTIWFNKDHPNVVYCDKRKEQHAGIWKSTLNDSKRVCEIAPDIQCDFTELPFDDNTFKLVVFDPPHLIHIGSTSWLAKKYGKLGEDWKQMLHDGFQECMRVNGVNLIYLLLMFGMQSGEDHYLDIIVENKVKLFGLAI